MTAELKEIEEKIGYRFRRAELLLAALTHKSFANEQPEPKPAHNERLEFLGDAVLSLVVGEMLYHKYKGEDEGRLTRLRAAAVSERSLAALARRLELGKWLRLGRGEETSGGRAKPSLLADAFEALLGALYLDGGLEEARRFLGDLFAQSEIALDAERFNRDYKSRLQELAQLHFGCQPAYRLVGEEGPEHQKLFTCEVLLGKESWGSGRGRSKKEAEQEAARQALQRLSAEEEGAAES